MLRRDLLKAASAVAVTSTDIVIRDGTGGVVELKGGSMTITAPPAFDPEFDLATELASVYLNISRSDDSAVVNAAKLKASLAVTYAWATRGPRLPIVSLAGFHEMIVDAARYRPMRVITPIFTFDEDDIVARPPHDPLPPPAVYTLGRTPPTQYLRGVSPRRFGEVAAASLADMARLIDADPAAVATLEAGIDCRREAFLFEFRLWATYACRV